MTFGEKVDFKTYSQRISLLLRRIGLLRRLGCWLVFKVELFSHLGVKYDYAVIWVNLILVQGGISRAERKSQVRQCLDC